MASTADLSKDDALLRHVSRTPRVGLIASLYGLLSRVSIDALGPSWVIHDRLTRSHPPAHVRFAPKATENPAEAAKRRNGPLTEVASTVRSLGGGNK